MKSQALEVSTLILDDSGTGCANHLGGYRIQRYRYEFRHGLFVGFGLQVSPNP